MGYTNFFDLPGTMHIENEEVDALFDRIAQSIIKELAGQGLKYKKEEVSLNLTPHGLKFTLNADIGIFDRTVFDKCFVQAVLANLA